ncbi:hypothetical protein ALC57_02875 [Trachymyrmex cornetzi]|uniref:Uncharacterized protein n=1 Tax=Trachymyrmex cornetzi TaxID=471704 RepID=A0A195EHT0_9HYME|nr:hypothetical protein ALC57_02875 [Trachymyrmex cornetzi]
MHFDGAQREVEVELLQIHSSGIASSNKVIALSPDCIRPDLVEYMQNILKVNKTWRLIERLISRGRLTEISCGIGDVTNSTEQAGGQGLSRRCVHHRHDKGDAHHRRDLSRYMTLHRSRATAS